MPNLTGLYKHQRDHTRGATRGRGKVRPASWSKVKSWWCQPCSQEVYSLRCKYCGKSEAEEN